MVTDLTFLELGNDIVDDFAGCTEPVCIARGDIYRAGIPLASYLARWFDGQLGRGVDLQITLGEWSAGAGWERRNIIGFHVTFMGLAATITFVDSDAVWCADLGNKFSARDAELYPIGALGRELAAAIVIHDPSISQFVAEGTGS